MCDHINLIMNKDLKLISDQLIKIGVELRNSEIDELFFDKLRVFNNFFRQIIQISENSDLSDERNIAIMKNVWKINKRLEKKLSDQKIDIKDEIVSMNKKASFYKKFILKADRNTFTKKG